MPLPGSPTLHLHADDALRQTVGGSAATAVDDPIGEWVARVGTSPTQATAGRRLKVAITGGKRYVACTGNANQGALVIPAGSLVVTNPITIFCSVVIPTGGNDGFFLRLHGNFAAQQFGLGTASGNSIGTGNGFQVLAVNEQSAWVPTGLNATADVLLPIVITVPSSGNITFYVGGSTFTTATWAFPAASDFALSIGGVNSSGTLRFANNALIREIGFYSSVLGTTDINTLLART